MRTNTGRTRSPPEPPGRLSAAQQWVPTAQVHHQRATETDRETGKCVRTRAGWGQAGSKCSHSLAKNAVRHA